MFTLPDDLKGYKKQSEVFYYEHINRTETNNSKLHFTKSCISIGINGTKKLQTTSGSELFDEGDLVFYTPGNYLSYQHIDTDRPYRCLMIFFDAHPFAKLSRQFNDEPEPAPGSASDRQYLYLRKDKYIPIFLEGVSHLRDHGKGFNMELQKIKLIELIGYLKGKFGKRFIEVGVRPQRQLSEFQLQKVIENNTNSNLKIEELAFMCNMSLATFKRAFQKIYGTSPGRWIREKKLTWAKEQISRFHRMPAEVYYEAGYGDYSTFSYAFRQKFGASPRKWFLKTLSGPEQKTT